MFFHNYFAYIQIGCLLIDTVWWFSTGFALHYGLKLIILKKQHFFSPKKLPLNQSLQEKHNEILNC